uniref:Peptidase M12A domain-containing protein n=1 Tax=Glossina austeni TaxID=7395 RepID=A0A1A9UY29_GLOAU
MEFKILVFILYVLSLVYGNNYDDDDELSSEGCKEATDRHMKSDHESLNVCDIALRKLVVLKEAFDNVFDNVTQNYFDGGAEESHGRRTKQKLPPPLFWILEEIIKSAFEKTNSDFSESTTPSTPPTLSTSSDVETENLKGIPLADRNVQQGIPFITYHISDAYADFNKQRILKLFSVVEMVTCIKFSPTVNYEEANLLVTPHYNTNCESKMLMNETLIMNLGRPDCFKGKVLMRVLLDGLGVERDDNFGIWNPLADKQTITEEECLSLNAKYGCLVGSNTTKFIRHCRTLENYH